MFLIAFSRPTNRKTGEIISTFAKFPLTARFSRPTNRKNGEIINTNFYQIPTHRLIKNNFSPQVNLAVLLLSEQK